MLLVIYFMLDVLLLLFFAMKLISRARLMLRLPRAICLMPFQRARAANMLRAYKMLLY